MSCNVIFQKNFKKGKKDASGIWRLGCCHHVGVSKTHMCWPFQLVTGIVCKMYQVRFTKYRDNCSSNWPPYLLMCSKSF
jgi:hypothetical protein